MVIRIFRKLDWFGLRQQRLYNGKIDATWWQKKRFIFIRTDFCPAFLPLIATSAIAEPVDLGGRSPVDMSHVILVLYIPMSG